MAMKAYRSRKDKKFEVQRKDGHGRAWVPVLHTDDVKDAIKYCKDNFLALPDAEFRIVDEKGVVD